jgi:hypothetical protein
MADGVFSRGEVDALAEKLDSLRHELSPDERLLLIDIFAAAKHSVMSVQPPGPGEQEPTSADLKQQLVEAFLPHGVDHFVMRFIGSITGEPRQYP